MNKKEIIHVGTASTPMNYGCGPVPVNKTFVLATAPSKSNNCPKCGEDGFEICDEAVCIKLCTKCKYSPYDDLMEKTASKPDSRHPSLDKVGCYFKNGTGENGFHFFSKNESIMDNDVFIYNEGILWRVKR
jgi:hypothetical protein